MAGDTEAKQTAAVEQSCIFFGESKLRRPVVRWQGEACEERIDTLAPEEPLEIQLAGRSLTVTMRTPGHDEELAAGLLYAQELVHSAADLGAITRDPAQPNRLDVRLSEAVVAIDLQKREAKTAKDTYHYRRLVSSAPFPLRFSAWLITCRWRSMTPPKPPA